MSEAAVVRSRFGSGSTWGGRSRAVGLPVLLVLAPVVLWRVTGIDAVWFQIVGAGVCYAMMVLSLNLLMGYAGQISLGHAGLITAGAYASGMLTTRAGASFVVGVMGAALVGALLALLIGLPALRLRGLLLAVTTLGFLVVMHDAILPIRWLSGGSAGVSASRPTFGPISFQSNADYLALLLLLLLGFWSLDRNVTSTRLGRSFLAIREDEQVAASYGIDVARTKLVAFVLSGAMAGVAGAAFGHLQFGASSANAELSFSLSLVAWVIIGGLGSRAGVVSAGVLFGIFPAIFDQIFRWDLITEFSLTVGALLFLITVAINPNGFVGSIKEKKAEEAAKEAKARLKAGGVEVDDAALPSLPVPPPRHGAPEPGTPVLEVEDVTVRFGGLTALQGASITVNAGEIVGLIGPNGAGKTTLFDAIGGYNRPMSGSFRLLGRQLAGLGPHDRALAGLGRTFQRTGLAMSLSVRENLLLAKHALLDYDALLALGRTRQVREAEAAIDQRVTEIIGALGFESLADLPAKHLSGGQRRILEMACTLATAPDLLMLDEPTAGMAPAAVENLAERLRELRDEHGRTILLIEHHVPLVLDVCDRIYVLDHGILIAEGTPDDILRDPVVLEAYLGERAAKQAGLLEEVTA